MGYGSVAVRVCDDCHCQMENDSEEFSSHTSSDTQLPFSLNLEDSVNSNFTWKLTSDEAYNTTLREEFGFEHAPSVSLCLAILKLHSEHVAYPRLVTATTALEQQFQAEIICIHEDKFVLDTVFINEKIIMVVFGSK